MTFDMEKFENTKFRLPESEVEVPELRTFFAEGERPVWRVRMLRGSEWAKAEAAKNGRHQKVIEELVAGISRKDPKAVAQKFLAAIGMDSGVDPEMVRNRHIFEAGMVSPKVNRRQARQISEYYVVPFARAVNEIQKLSGRGPAIQGESSASGQTPGCGQPSHSAPEASSEGDSDSCMK